MGLMPQSRPISPTTSSACHSLLRNRDEIGAWESRARMADGFGGVTDGE
jgi:hypothetical protein